MEPGDYFHEIGFVIGCDIPESDKQVDYYCGNPSNSTKGIRNVKLYPNHN